MTTPARNYPRNCGTATSTFVLPPFAKKSVTQESFRLFLQTQRRLTGEAISPTPTTIGDRVVARSFSAPFVEDVQATAIRENGFFGPITFSSLTPSVAAGAETNDGLFQFSHVSNGTARVQATSQLGLSQIASIAISSGSAAQSDVWQEWASGSLARQIADDFVSRLSAAGGVIDPWQIKDHNQGVYTRRTSHWLYDVDLSCLSIWNSASGQNQAGTLITPEHAIFATHYPIAVGATVRFLNCSARNPGVLAFEDRTVVATASILPEEWSADIQVARLSDPVSSPFCKVLPTDTMEYLPSVSRNKDDNALRSWRPRLPIVATNQDKHFGYLPCFSLRESWGTTIGNFSEPWMFEVNQPAAVSFPGLVPFVRRGCSGHPLFLLVAGELILIGLYFSASSGASFERQLIHDEVNAALTTLGGGYQLTPADLSAFPSY